MLTPHLKAFPAGCLAVLLTVLALPSARADFLLIRPHRFAFPGLFEGRGQSTHSNSTSGGDMGSGGTGGTGNMNPSSSAVHPSTLASDHGRAGRGTTSPTMLHQRETEQVGKQRFLLQTTGSASLSGFAPARGCAAAPCMINVATGSVSYNQSSVSDAMTTLYTLYTLANGLSANLSGSGQTQTVNTSTGKLTANGNGVLDASSFIFNNGTTHLINDPASGDSVVFNFTFTHNSESADTIVLNGLTRDQVLSNISAGVSLTGSSTLPDSPNGTLQTVVFLGANGVGSTNRSTLDVFGGYTPKAGSTQTLQIVSADTLTGPSGPVPTPEPLSIVLFGTVLVGCGAVARRRVRHSRSG